MNHRSTGAETRPVAPRVGAQVRSGIEVPVVVDPQAFAVGDPGKPGEFPFTRGIFPDGYRGRLWTMRQYSGFVDEVR